MWMSLLTMTTKMMAMVMVTGAEAVATKTMMTTHTQQ
jgi:hypothetical protein